MEVDQYVFLPFFTLKGATVGISILLCVVAFSQILSFPLLLEFENSISDTKFS